MSARSMMVAIGLVTALVGCGPTPDAGPKARSTTEATASGAGPIVYTKRWDGNGTNGAVEVKRPSDLVKLTGAPADFVDFVGTELAGMAYEGCEPPVISVDGIDAETGVAKGSEWSCHEGAETIWIRWDGRWLLAEGSQMGWPCETLKKYMVPAEITAPSCDEYIGSTTKHVHYKGPASAPTKKGTPGRRIVYMSTLDADSHGADGLRINVEDDPAPLLKGAPSAFVDVIDEQRSEGCNLMIDGIDPSVGIATGSAMECENARAIIWIRWNGRWMEAISHSGRWPCDDLKRYRVPAGLAGSTCSEWNDEGEEAVVGYEPPAA